MALTLALTLAPRLRRLIFGISPDEATFRKRGFHSSDEQSRAHLEKIGCVFLDGYHLALEESNILALGSRLDETEPLFRGFAFEGAAMALAILDCLTPWKRNRLRTFVEGPAANHLYMAYVGAGWAMARLRRNIDRALQDLDPLLGWLAVDGYGFHEGYFDSISTIRRRKVPRRFSGYSLRAFDQGLGRSLWFVRGADVRGISETIAEFEPARRA